VKQAVIWPENARTHASQSNVRGGPMRALTIDVSGLERDLRAAVRGEVRFDDGSLALYTSDASNYRQVPIGIVLPLDAEDVAKTVEICRGYGAPILAR
jgi:FAD/FMN-containing dehydrogenase